MKHTRKLRKLTITLVGSQGSGKSTLLHVFRHAIDQSAVAAGFNVLFFQHTLAQLLLEDQVPPTTAFEPMKGVMTRGAARYQFEVWDTPGGSLTAGDKVDEALPPDKWPDLERLTIASNLLMIAISPADLEDTEGFLVFRGKINEHVHRLVERDRDAMIIIALTKSDEYGVLDSKRARLIDTKDRRKALAVWRRDKIDRAFVDAVCFNDDAWSPTLHALISKIKPLLSDIVSQANTSLFNVYLVKARPAEPHIIPFPLEQRGVTEIFSDFFEYAIRRWPQPSVPMWATSAILVGGAAAAIARLSGESTFWIAAIALIAALLVVAIRIAFKLLGGVALWERLTSGLDRTTSGGLQIVTKTFSRNAEGS